ncbi:DUF5979 domain-containing protein [Gemmiger formicilis]|nr:DUF5979 domain-containing protein [Gemmiger formicilis]
MVFNNKVKTGKLIIRKVPAAGEERQLEGKTFTFTVRFGDVGGQSLGGIIPPIQHECMVEKHGDEYYGEIVIDKIPVGTRFVVSENKQAGTSLQSVSIEGVTDRAVSADGMAYGTIECGKTATATFVNTARELIDIAVKKSGKRRTVRRTFRKPTCPTPFTCNCSAPKRRTLQTAGYRFRGMKA